MPKKVFITRKIPDAGIKLLKAKKYKVIVSPHDRVINRSEIIKMGKGCDALLPLLTDPIDGDLLDALGPQLKVVANYAVGYDNINVPDCYDRGIKVGNTAGVLDGSVAEHTFALMLAIAKRIVEADAFSKAGKYKGWEPDLLLTPLLLNKTLGVIGLGNIGKSVVAKAHAFGMNILYTDIVRDKKFEKKYKAKFVNKETLLKQSDFVSLHVPLLPSTKHLISTKELRMMKMTAYLVNTSRGPVINEKALYKALDKKVIKGAAIDVLECEPKIGCDADLRKLAKKLDNLIITPHIASATIEARDNMSILACKNIIAALEGKKMPSQVKPKK